MLSANMSAMASEERIWGGTTLSQRKAQRRADLIASAIELIGEVGTAALTTKAVCDRAGVIPRYLYESFDSRDELVVAAFDTLAERGTALLLQSFAATPDAPARDRLREALAAGIDFAADEPAVFKLLFGDAENDPALRDRLLWVQSTLEQVLAQMLPQLRPEPASPAAAAFHAKAVVGAAISVFTAWVDGGIDLTRDQLLDASLAAIEAIAAVDVSPGP
jgi:AcrR family transcriptional regulator